MSDRCFSASHLKVNVTMLHVGEKNLDLSNIVCEYEINPLTYDKVITEIQMLTQIIKLPKNNVKCQGHLKVNVIMRVCKKLMT